MEPKYTIYVKPEDILIVRDADMATMSGNYYTNPELKEFCDTLSLKSCTRRCVPACPKGPYIQVITEISEIQKDYNGNTVICFPRNPFLDNFAVKEYNFEFIKGQNVWYRDSDPKTMLILDSTRSVTIVEHYKHGWIDKTRYEYYHLNLASRSLYDLLSKSRLPGFKHCEIYQYLQDVEKLVEQGNDAFLAGKPEEYIQKAKILAQEYEKIIKKSIMLPNTKELDGLMHKSEVLNSPIVKNPSYFVPSKASLNDNTNTQMRFELAKLLERYNGK